MPVYFRTFVFHHKIYTRRKSHDKHDGACGKGDYAQAKEYYGRVVNEFAGSDVFSQAEARMNEIINL